MLAKAVCFCSAHWYRCHRRQCPEHVVSSAPGKRQGNSRLFDSKTLTSSFHPPSLPPPLLPSLPPPPPFLQFRLNSAGYPYKLWLFEASACQLVSSPPPSPQASLSAKTTAPLLRVSFLLCVSALCDEELDPALLPLPLQSLERGAANLSPQLPALEETLVALDLAVRLSFPNPIPQEVWSVADSHSEQLVSAKLITAASEKCK